MRLLRLPQVVERTGMCRASIYNKMNAGEFPRSVPLGVTAVAWSEAEIDAYITAKIAARDSAATKTTAATKSKRMQELRQRRADAEAA